MTGKQGPQSLKDIRTDRILTGKERRGDQSAPGVLSVATGWVPNLQSYTSAQPWVFIHSLLQLDQSVLHVPKACVCVCVCTCVLGEDICVCLLRDWGHLQCMQVESVLCVCVCVCNLWIHDRKHSDVKKQICACAQSLSHVWLFATPWTVAHQAPLLIGIL